MTVPQFKRRRQRLLLGLLSISAVIASAPAASAAPLARSGPPPITLTWSTVSPPAAPPPLAYASAVYDSDSKTVVLFGGAEAGGHLSNDTWVWNGTTWTDYPGSEVQAPPAREMASMAFDPKLHQLILFGGLGAGRKLLNDTWAWNGASWYDETASSPAPRPSARIDAAMAYDGAGNLVLFGGTGGVDAADPPATTPASDPPDPATALPLATTSSSPSSLSSSPASTSPLSSSPLPPSPASSTTASGAASGTPTSSSPSVPSADAASNWTTPVAKPKATSARPLEPSASSTVPAASSTVAASPASRQLASGSPAVATASTAVLGDTWLWTGNGWTAAPGLGPSARTGAALEFDPMANVTVLFGGASVPMQLGPVRPAPAHSGPVQRGTVHPGSGNPLADTWAWNGQAWHRLAIAASPPGRDDAALVADGSTGGLVLFGGSGTRADLSDAWLWSGSSWTPARTAGALSPRAGAATAYDAATSKVLVFGGVGPAGSTLDDTVMLGETAPVALSGGAGSGPSSTSTQPAGSSQAAGTGRGTPSSSSSPPTHSGLSPAHPSHPLHKGDLVTLSGTSFLAGAPITIWFHSEPVVVGKAVANRFGDFTATVAVPDSASDGIHRFEAAGQGRTGPISELIATVRIVGPGSDLATSTFQRVVLTAIAVLIPAATWMALVGAGRVRRRKAALR